MVEAGGVESVQDFVVVRDRVNSFVFPQTPFFVNRTSAHQNARSVSRPVPSDRGGGGVRVRGGPTQPDGFVERKIFGKRAKLHFGNLP